MEEAEKAARLAAQKAKEDRIVADIKRRLEASKRPLAPDTRSVEEIIRDQIEILAGDADIFIPKKPKGWKGLPEGWRVIAQYAKDHGDNKAVDDFPTEFQDSNYYSFG